MGIREKLRERSGLAVGVAVALILISVSVLLWQSSAGAPGTSGRAFFSDDDGKTFFVDDAAKIPPFEHRGRQACRAYVVTCDGGKTKWIGYLERYTQEGKSRLEGRGGGSPTKAIQECVEIKKPGDSEWVKYTDVVRSLQVMEFKCPHNGSHPVQLVSP